MARQTHYLELYADETAAHIVERLNALPRGARALFILPPDAPPLRERLDLTLVLRAAGRRAIRIAIVSDHPQVISQAAALQVSTFDTIGAAEAKRWKRGRARAFSGREDREDAELELPKQPHSSAPPPASTPLGTAWRFFYRTLATILLLSIPILTAAFFIPSAHITFMPHLTTLEHSLTLNADPHAEQIDFEQGIIPVTQFVVRTERSARRPSSGSTVQPQSLASGVITFTNRTTSEIFIPAGTVLATSAEEPLRFRTTDVAIVPAGFGEITEVGIEALQSSAGKRGNLPAGAISVIGPPYAESIRVVNAEATGGGRDATYAVVTAADRDELRTQLESAIIAAAYEEMSARLNSGQTIILQSLTIPPDRQQESWAQYSAAVGEIVDEVQLTLSAEVVALAYHQADVHQVALAQLAAARQADQLFLPERTWVECCVVTAENEDGSISLRLRASAHYAPDLAIDDYRAPLAGRRPADAVQWLRENVPLAADSQPELDLFPTWFRRIPFWAERITFETVLPEAP